MIVDTFEARGEGEGGGTEKRNHLWGLYRGYYVQAGTAH